MLTLSNGGVSDAFVGSSAEVMTLSSESDGSNGNDEATMAALREMEFKAVSESVIQDVAALREEIRRIATGRLEVDVNNSVLRQDLALQA